VDLILALALLGLAVAPLALLSGWLAGRGSRPLGALVNTGGSEGWWRSTMPWPRGVQEDDELTWTVGTAPKATPSPRRAPVDPGVADELNVEPTHLRPLIRRR
jgi:hypothetical protein